MRTVVATGPGQVELNTMWLPTWLSFETSVLEEIERDLGPELVGQALDDATLDRAHERVLRILETKFPNLPGLRAHLDSLKAVRIA